MAFTHTLKFGWGTGARSLEDNPTFSGDGQESLQIAIADSVTDQLASIAIDVSAIQAIYMVSDQDLTVETNSASVPDETLNLLANKPYVWYTGSLFTNLLATDITALYLSNSSGSAATFELEVVVDATP